MTSSVDQKIRDKFSNLTGRVGFMLANVGYQGSGLLPVWPPEADWMQWRSEAFNLIERACGRNSAHFQHFQDVGASPGFIVNGAGILRAAQQDWEAGMLFDVRETIRAELLDNFLEQAEALLKNSYYVAAVSLSGAVLEDTLRKLCDKNSISYDSQKTSLEALNVKLGPADIYNRLTLKQLTAFAELRNHADHGHFDKVRNEDAEQMVRWVRRFVTDHLGG